MFSRMDSFLGRFVAAVVLTIAATILLRAEVGPLSSTFTNWIDQLDEAAADPSDGNRLIEE